MAAAWRRPRTSGAAWLEGGRLAGYLYGSTSADDVRGRHVWVEMAGHAVAPAAVDRVKDLYAAAGAGWVGEGCYDHYIVAPAGERALLETWFALSFGQEQAHALCDLRGRAGRAAVAPGVLPETDTFSHPERSEGSTAAGPGIVTARVEPGHPERSEGSTSMDLVDPALQPALRLASAQGDNLRQYDYRQPETPPAAPAGVEIRPARATDRDREHLAAMSQWIREYQAGAPVWGAALPEDAAEVRAGYREIVDEEGWFVWLALEGDRPLGFQAYAPAAAGSGNLLVPERCVELKVAATAAAARGRGIGLALTRAGFADALRRGYEVCLTDWRTTNLLSSRFWPARGFTPAAYRLVRRVDPRVAWAR